MENKTKEIKKDNSGWYTLLVIAGLIFIPNLFNSNSTSKVSNSTSPNTNYTYQPTTQVVKQTTYVNNTTTKDYNYDTCCKHCVKGKACGDTCISKSYTCHKAPGCACDY